MALGEGVVHCNALGPIWCGLFTYLLSGLFPPEQCPDDRNPAQSGALYATALHHHLICTYCSHGGVVSPLHERCPLRIIHCCDAPADPPTHEIFLLTSPDTYTLGLPCDQNNNKIHRDGEYTYEISACSENPKYEHKIN